MTEFSVTGQKESREWIKDLFAHRPAIYWPDYLSVVGLGWAAVAVAVSAQGWLTFAATLIAVFALYRATLFIHEISHMKKGDVPGFELVWNVLTGIPMCAPSFTYVGVHTDHHRRTIYGTAKDPEYTPFACVSRWKIFVSVIEQPLVPAVFLVRFLVATPFGLVFPVVHRWLERHASSLVINTLYRRENIDVVFRRRMIRLELGILVFWGMLVALAAKGILPWKYFAVWYVVTFGIAFVNHIRTLGAHHYRNPGVEVDVVGQLTDTVNVVPGKFYTELWAPVGLRYHALHHYMPDLPYHSLGVAHRRLMARLPESAPYRRVNHPHLWGVIKALWAEASAQEKRIDDTSLKNC